ncbi:putative Hemicentin-1 [Daphnia magna]|nr:putative Hemicentin-1 [Daphnia magna]
MTMDLRRPLLIFALYVVLLQLADVIADDESIQLEKVTVLSGKTAVLPCDITPPTLDSLYLVLWYKNDSDFPIYK